MMENQWWWLLKDGARYHYRVIWVGSESVFDCDLRYLFLLFCLFCPPFRFFFDITRNEWPALSLPQLRWHTTVHVFSNVHPQGAGARIQPLVIPSIIDKMSPTPHLR